MEIWSKFAFGHICSERVKEIKGSNPVQAWVFTGFLFKTAKKKVMILFTSLIGDKTKTEEGFTYRQYCFGLLGLISAVLMLGWRLSYKATPNDPKNVVSSLIAIPECSN